MARDLCVLSDVTSYAPGYVTYGPTDTKLGSLITAVSADIMRDTGREIIQINPAVLTRRFDLGEYEIMNRIVMIGDLAAPPTTVTVYNLDQVGVSTVVVAPAWVALPRVREEWEPITSLYFPPYASGAPLPIVGQVLEVVGSAWGFPAVPADLKEACAATVIFRYLSDVSSTGTQFAEALATASVNVGALFSFARDVVSRYGPVVGVA